MQTQTAAPLLLPAIVRLNQQVMLYIDSGYHIVWRDDQAAQMLLPKRLDAWAGIAFAVGFPFVGSLLAIVIPILGFALIGLGTLLFVAQLIWYLGARDRTAFLYLDENGVVQAIRR